MTLYLVCLVLAIAVSRTGEWLDGTPLIAAPLRLELPRLLVPAALYSLVYIITFRPLSALALIGGGAVVLFIANRLKRMVVFEPIVYSDLALLGQILRHPRLYFLDRNLHLTIPAALLGMVLLGLAIACEPAILPSPALLIALAAGAGLAWWQRQAITDHYGALLLDAEGDWGTARLGLTAALALQALGALSQRPENAQVPRLTLPDPTRDIVVIQLESFTDLGEWPDIAHRLTNWSRLRAIASHHGALEVGARGANTMRTEFSVLTGIAGSRLGFDRFDPYLRRNPQGRGLPVQLRAGGWATHCLHPNDIAFFRRHLAMPEIGFTDIHDIASFASAARNGPYVSDMALVEAILQQLEGATAPSFIFAISMENHGPWRPGRLEGVAGGLATYLAHQDNMDAALGRLVAAMMQRATPPILVLYGDHSPALTDRPDIALNSLPTYAVIDLAHPQAEPRAPSTLPPESLLPTALSARRF